MDVRYDGDFFYASAGKKFFFFFRDGHSQIGLLGHFNFQFAHLLPIHIDRSAFGAVLQAGFDVNLQDKWLVNFDVKKIWVNTDVKLDGTGVLTHAGLTGFQKIDKLDLNPLVLSIGIGKKF